MARWEAINRAMLLREDLGNAARARRLRAVAVRKRALGISLPEAAS